MYTFFSVEIKETNDRMREELNLLVLPFLRERGFVGKLPFLRRQLEGKSHSVQFQFNKYGGSLAVNLQIYEDNADFLQTKKSNLQSVGFQRLGTRKKPVNIFSKNDHWFTFLTGFLVYRQSYRRAARRIKKTFESEGELIFADLENNSQRLN